MNTDQSFLGELRTRGLCEQFTKIARSHGVKLDELRSRMRTASIVRARREAMLFLREDKAWSYTEIGKLFQRDHTSVITLLRGKTQRLPKLELELELEPVAPLLARTYAIKLAEGVA